MFHKVNEIVIKSGNSFQLTENDQIMLKNLELSQNDYI